MKTEETAQTNPETIVVQTATDPKPTGGNTDTPTVETIEAAVKGGAKSLTEVAHALGRKGSISGHLAWQIKKLVPDIMNRLKTNAEIAKLPTPPISSKPLTKGSAKAVKSAKKSKDGKDTKAAKPVPKAMLKSKYRRHPANPFREGSGYGLAFDVLASHKDGIVRADLVKAYSTASRKPLKRASFDIAVLLSPKSEKPTSERHRSCREGYGIRKENSHITLTLP